MPAKPDSRPVALWLFACCGMVFVMALLGAVTRLTESGLSITDWNPVMGALPPLDAAAWNKAFATYKEIPQYQLLHSSMTLAEFKGIYFWEWLHRLWGRLIGVVFAAPFIWFLFDRRFDKKTGSYLAAIFGLGALQGFIGWFMVQSGLAVRTSVSPYRLALHLGFALLIYALMLWAGLKLWSPLPPWGGDEGSEIFQNKNPTISLSARPPSSQTLLPPKGGEGLKVHGWIALGFVAVTMLWGAFVAGLHAGEAYNTWPLMEGEVLPSAAFTLNPAWINAFENLALVQFIHRWLGPVTMIVVLAWVARRWKDADRDSKRWLHALGGMAVLQVALGLATLLSHAEIALAVLHQAGAIALMTLLLVNLKNFYSSDKFNRGKATDL